MCVYPVNTPTNKLNHNIFIKAKKERGLTNGGKLLQFYLCTFFDLFFNYKKLSESMKADINFKRKLLFN